MTESSLREALLSVRQRAAIMRDSLFGPTRQLGREILELIDHGLAGGSKLCNLPKSRICVACGAAARARGLCNACYQKARKMAIRRCTWQPRPQAAKNP
jgi:hypothetical protein